MARGGWSPSIANAALGIVAWGALEIVDAAMGRAPADRRSLGQRAAAFGLAAVLAGAYARLVPCEHWGVRSGMAFAQLRSVGLMARAGGRQRALASAAELALWGAATGLLMRALGTPHQRPAWRVLPLLEMVRL